MLHLRNTKIVATLGPASSSKEIIKSMFENGVNVFRLNFSHGDHDGHRKNFESIRELESIYNCPTAVLIDLQGPKLRVNIFANGSEILQNGDEFTFDLNTDPGSNYRVNLPHPEIFQAIKPGAELLVDDGKLRFKVIAHGADFIKTQVIVGGKISNRKGVNVPDATLPISIITEKDKNDLEFGLSLGADWVAISFVQTPDDVRQAREMIGDRAQIVAKIEKPQALENLEEIISLADGIMVARGDLGVEVPPERVPAIQKRIIDLCRKSGKPVIVATQMLESMINSPTPTRAEASDVAQAVYDGADAVMLSAESANGILPVHSVAMMNRIIVSVENDEYYYTMIQNFLRRSRDSEADPVIVSAKNMAKKQKALAINVISTTGCLPKQVAQARPEVPIVALSRNLNVARFLNLVWGVVPVYVNVNDGNYQYLYGDMMQALKAALKERYNPNGKNPIIMVGHDGREEGAEDPVIVSLLDAN